MIKEKLVIEDAYIERAHRMGNTNKTSLRAIIANVSSFKWKQSFFLLPKS